MNTGLRCIVTALIAIMALALPGYAGQLDDHYLSAFGQHPGSALEKAVLSPVTGADEAAHCGTPLKHGLSRDWNKLESGTQKVLAKQLALPILSGSEFIANSSGGHFRVHYTTSGTDAPNIAAINQFTGLGLTSAADWANKVGDAFDEAFAHYQNLGYHMPPTNPYDVYLTSLASKREYGETQDIQFVPSAGFSFASSSFIQIDKDFTATVFKPQTYTPLQSLQITSAHEFHHAVQYGYNFYFDVWYAEATSTWFEDEVHDTVNQSYSYIAPWFQGSTKQLDLAVDSFATSTGAGYGRWIFNRYLAETHTVSVVRSFWEKLALLDPASNPLNSDGDIRMTPVLDSVLSTTYTSTLGTDFFGFAKRVYMRDWTSHTNEVGPPSQFIPLYVPVASYSSYPVTSTSSATPSVTLPHYSFAYYKFLPTAGVPTNLTLTINGTSGIKATTFVKSSGGVLTENPFTTVSGSSVTVPGFSSSSEAVLLIVNTSGQDGENANFSTDGNTTAVTDPATPTSSSGTVGCFIATAAYGSYLHPQVHQLRRFRDDYLLTNAPGRAFVALYYRCSPPLADFIARHTVLRSVTRLALTPLVLAFVHPLVSAASLFLLIGAALLLRVRRINTARSNANPDIIRTT